MKHLRGLAKAPWRSRWFWPLPAVTAIILVSFGASLVSACGSMSGEPMPRRSRPLVKNEGLTAADKACIKRRRAVWPEAALTYLYNRRSLCLAMEDEISQDDLGAAADAHSFFQRLSAVPIGDTANTAANLVILYLTRLPQRSLLDAVLTSSGSFIGKAEIARSAAKAAALAGQDDSQRFTGDDSEIDGMSVDGDGNDEGACLIGAASEADIPYPPSVAFEVVAARPSLDPIVVLSVYQDLLAPCSFDYKADARVCDTELLAFGFGLAEQSLGAAPGEELASLQHDSEAEKTLWLGIKKAENLPSLSSKLRRVLAHAYWAAGNSPEGALYANVWPTVVYIMDTLPAYTVTGLDEVCLSGEDTLQLNECKAAVDALKLSSTK